MNSQNNLPKKTDTISDLANVAKYADAIVDKIGEIWIEGKNLENKGLEISLLRDEIIEYYRVEKVRLVKAFKENKKRRQKVEKLILHCIEKGDDKGRSDLIALYRDILLSNIPDTNVRQFKDSKMNDTEEGEVIDIT